MRAFSLFHAPTVPVSRAVWKIVGDLLPPLILIFLVLGTIFQGIATPTEGGAMGAVGALVLAIARRRLRLSLLRQALESTTKLSSFVVFILIGARVFSLTFYGVDGHKWVEHLLVSLPGGQVGFLIVVNAVVFVLAFFLDFFELAFIIVPLLAGPAEALGIDLIWFGVLLGINMQTSFMHPPFGFALFYLRSVAPRERYRDRRDGQARWTAVTTGQIYWGAVPFVIIQVIMVGLAIAFPQMIMHYKGVGTGIDPATLDIQIPTAAAEASNFLTSERPHRQTSDARRRRTSGSLRPSARFPGAAALRPLASRPRSTETGGATPPRFIRRSSDGARARPSPSERLGALLAHHEAVERPLRHLPPEDSLRL